MNGAPASPSASRPAGRPLRRGVVLSRSIAASARAAFEREWFGSPPHRAVISNPKPVGLSARPHDPRPVEVQRGRQLLDGVLTLHDESLKVGTEGDPFDTPSPSRAFAVALHRFDWLPGLLAHGPEGSRRALRLIQDWRRVFGTWNQFSWAGECLERRTFHLACAAKILSAEASDAETAALALDIARGARQLLKASDAPDRALERLSLIHI